MKTFPEIDTEEIKVAVFDFDRDLEVSASVASFSIDPSVHKGEDSSPEIVVVGLPQILGRQVMQRIRGHVDGCIYKLRARAVDSNGLVHVIVYLLPSKFG